MALPDAEILRNAETLFCACEAGQALRTMVERRNASFMQWLKTTETAQREAAARIAAGAFGLAGIPDRFRNATWAGMRNRCEKDPGKKEALMLTYRLLQDGYIERQGVRKKSLLLWSKQRGVGKTWLATAVFKQAIKNRPGLWIWFHRLVESVRAGYNGNGDAYKLLAQARDIDVLLLDELGHNWRDDATAHTVEVLHSVLFYRHAYDLPTIFTSNKSPDELATMFGEEHWQRIGEMAAIIEMSGETLREIG